MRHPIVPAKRRPPAPSGILAAAMTVALGFASAPLLRAQADPNLRFEVASVRRVEIADLNGRLAIFPPPAVLARPIRAASPTTQHNWFR